MKELCPLIWKGGRLFVIDQRVLPHKEVWLELKSDRDVYRAIRDMVIRGAPAIGIVAAFGILLKARTMGNRNIKGFMKGIVESVGYLRKARPTAVNLEWALMRMKKKAEEAVSRGEDLKGVIEALEREAIEILREDIEINRRIGFYGNEVVPVKARILTHCNAGALAVGGYGTAIGVIRAAFETGKDITVFVDETRPYLQGARLTAYELKRLGIRHYIITDNAAGYLMQKGEVDLVVTGADRIALNGDTANKIGTYSLAVLAKENNVPFYIAAPLSTFDITKKSGSEIPIEERGEREVLYINGKPIAPKGSKARHIAFDVTPSRYITGIITPEGILRPPYYKSIKKLFKSKVLR